MWPEKEKKPIIPYLLITFAITYASEFFIILLEKLHVLPEPAIKAVAMALIAVGGALAPGIAVYILLKKAGHINGIKDYLKRVFAWKSGKSFCITLILAFFVFFLFVLFTEEHRPDVPYFVIPFMVIFMIPGGGWEELGWRGFLQPALEEKMSFIPATLLMGVIWSVWHAPLWLVQSANQKDFLFPVFALYCVALSFLLAVTYRETKCVLAPILLHAWANTICGGVYTYSVLTQWPTVTVYILFAILIAGSSAVYYLRRNA